MITITLSEDEKGLLLLVIDDMLDQLDMDSLNEVALLGEVKDKLQAAA
ncbi:hypothetical protein [Curtobacterium sp. MCSS17_007]|nr:hypothetical protein [Curtobacterium sp. MCSS17_007]WIE74507.1 hypothetical protein DEJ22_009450 [Curtobacterium sp. MCSS17_007]